ncbi:MAG TPA: hypothetical protein VM901_07000 [Bdellovibrionota bacterium]|jgi:hypothetical protein|nr:hypothetical protein [Bdellovibrionota bacterium]
MKTTWGLFLLALASAAAPAHTPAAGLDIPPDATSGIYRNELGKRLRPLNDLDGERDAPAVAEALRLGERNLAWLAHLNAHRGERPALSFTSPSNTTGVPITSPKRYSDVSVERDLSAFKAAADASFLNVILGSASFPNEIPLAEAEYLALGYKLDRVYQTAARWKLMQPYLWQLAARERDDIRGFYFLERESDLSSKLQNFASLDAEKQGALRGHLENLCFNNARYSKAQCRSRFETSLSQNQLVDFFAAARPSGEQRFSRLYNLNVRRDDLQWQGSNAHLSFVDPGTQTVRDFLKVNIEDEWQRPDLTTGAWNLLIDFAGQSGLSPFVTFVPGATPNVNGLGGNRITMDANAPLSEYDVQWTIRHEFGHVLGFPDCYVEFYDEPAQEMVNYQIDTTDLMCSRQGKMNTRLYEALRQTYEGTAR